MIIKDHQSKYEIKVDLERCIVYEKNMGIWTKEDLDRFYNDYSTKIIPLFKGKEWFKSVDLTELLVSNISNEINEFVAWCVKNKLFGGVIIVKNETIAMQMNLSAIYSGIKFSPLIFTNAKEADNWLNSHWL